MSGADPFLEAIDLRPSPEEVEQNYGYRERYESSNTFFERLDTPAISEDQIAALISDEAHKLVLDFEVDGRKGYDRRYCHPCRPPDPSGVTIGFGYDLGFAGPAEFLQHWKPEISAEDCQRLAPTVGLKSDRAQAAYSDVKAIVIPWEAAEKVYRKKTVPAEGRKTAALFRGAEKLHPHCFGALFSLVYNRGTALEGDRRAEMRNIRDLIAAGKPEGVPHELRAMKHLWTTSAPGLVKRREAEAVLFEKGLIEADKANRVIPGPAISLGPTSGTQVATLERVQGLAFAADEDGDGKFFGDADYQAQPAAPRHNELEALPGWGNVRWVDDDTLSTEYSHILDTDRTRLKEARFLFSRADLELLISANSFQPLVDRERIIFGLRGTLLDHDTAGPDDRFFQVNRQSLRLKVTRPDHANFRCVIGVLNLKTGLISGFVATTVPNRGAVWSFAKGGEAGNLLACGCYRYVVGAHHSGKYKGCLRQDEPFTVLRSRDNLVYDVRDSWDLRTDPPPMDNIHPAFADGAYGSAEFSSFGCQTIRGRRDDNDNYTDEFAKFRAVLGLGSPGSDDGHNYSYVLLTGQEAAIAAGLRADEKKDTSHAAVRDSLVRLRQGSQGDTVRKLQTALGLKPDGVFSAAMKMKLAEFQKTQGGDKAGDGIYSPALDRSLSLNVFGEQVLASTAPPIRMAAAATGNGKLESAGGGNPDQLEAVYYELGRRAAFAQTNPELLTATVLPHYEAITTESWVSTVAIGKRVLASLEQRTHALICGDGQADKGDRDKAQAALGSVAGQGRDQVVVVLTGIVSGWLLVPAIVSRPVCEILVDRVFGGLADSMPASVNDSMASVCQIWGRRLFEQSLPDSGSGPTKAPPPAPAAERPKLSPAPAAPAPAPVAAPAIQQGGNL